MSEQTSKLKLPYILAAQSQKHVTHNEALRMLDTLIHIKVESLFISTPPSNPEEGDAYIIAHNPTDVWQNKENQIANFIDGAWQYHIPSEGYISWSIGDQSLYIYKSLSGWDKIDTSSSQDQTMFGINTKADNINRLAVKSDAVLFSYDDVTPGSGDVRASINKSNEDNTASFVFQDNWSGRAEIGLTGDNDFHIKVSPDGSNWNEAITIDKDTGYVELVANKFNDEGAPVGRLPNEVKRARRYSLPAMRSSGGGPITTPFLDRWNSIDWGYSVGYKIYCYGGYPHSNYTEYYWPGAASPPDLIYASGQKPTFSVTDHGQQTPDGSAYGHPTGKRTLNITIPGYYGYTFVVEVISSPINGVYGYDEPGIGDPTFGNGIGAGKTVFHTLTTAEIRGE